MSDVFTKKKRSWIMSRIKSKNTKIENTFAKKLRKLNIKFIRHPKIYGNPDFLIGNTLVIFIDGCFWHKCPYHYKEPKSKKKFWVQKIESNVERDRNVTKNLRKDGYKVLRFWEHKIEKQSEKCIRDIIDSLE